MRLVGDDASDDSQDDSETCQYHFDRLMQCGDAVLRDIVTLLLWRDSLGWRGSGTMRSSLHPLQSGRHDTVAPDPLRLFCFDENLHFNVNASASALSSAPTRATVRLTSVSVGVIASASLALILIMVRCNMSCILCRCPV